MEIRKIKAQTVCDTVKKLFTDCNYFIGKDIMCALETARDNESSPVGKSVLSQIIENDKIAAREEVPLCQDTGMAVLFVDTVTGLLLRTAVLMRQSTRAFAEPILTATFARV